MMKTQDIEALGRMLEGLADAPTLDLRLTRSGYAIRMKRDAAPTRRIMEVEAKAAGILRWTSADGDAPAIGAETAPRAILGFIEAETHRIAVRAPRRGVVERRLAPDGEPVTAGQPVIALRPLAG
ncbi:MAG: hypothetical protein AAFN79_17945 [Pseudomonadota bacterium]